VALCLPVTNRFLKKNLVTTVRRCLGAGVPGLDYKTQRKIRIGSKSHAYAVRLKKAPSLAIEGWDALPAVLSQETPGQPRQQKLKREQGT
jgi:hypothetical protein